MSHLFRLPPSTSRLGFVSTWLSITLVLMAFSEAIYWAGITSIAKAHWDPRLDRPLVRPDLLTWCCRGMRLTIRR